MNFQAYKAHARELLATERGARLVRLDCMNPVKALADLRPVVPDRLGRSSRAQVEAAWRARFALERAAGRVSLATGVRPLLSRLFAGFAREGRHLHAPEDVYPVYLELAAAAGLTVSTFPTVPAPAFPTAAPAGRAEVLLVPDPLMPLGRGLDRAEGARLSSWLDEDERRLLVLDGVYTFDDRFTPVAEALLSRGRTILLHSLAKSFLSPDTAGFAIGPEGALRGLDDELGDEALATARHVLDEAADLPVRLGRLFRERWARSSQATGRVAPATGYFCVVPSSFDELLDRGQLAVPGTVFGARDTRWCAATCLLVDERHG